MTPPEDTSALPHLLALDRQAVLGGLSAGIVHAINNVLGGILGQTDLLLLNQFEPQMKSDLEQIASTCEEGVRLIRSLSLVVSTMKDEQPADVKSIMAAVIVLLTRIYNRAGIEKEVSFESKTPTAQYGAEFTQAIFHLGLTAYQTLSQNELSKRRISIQISNEHNNINLILTGASELFPALTTTAIHQSDSLADQTAEDVEWHRWVLTQVTERAGGKWGVSDDRCSMYLVWPAASGGATMIY